MPDRPRILWLHTQPEHYHNCMLDDLARRGNYDYTAAFCFNGATPYKDYPVPREVPTIFLMPRVPGSPRPKPLEKYHADWRRDLSPEKFDAVIVSGYGARTQRELIFDCHRRGTPVAMWSDSNIRSQRGRSVKSRAKRWLKKKLLARLIRASDILLTANSRGVAYWRYFGADREKIVCSPCYSDYGKIADAVASGREQSIGFLNLPPGDRYLFTSARLAPEKGIGLMLRAFTQARLGEKGWHYVIAGMGPLDSELKALAGDALGKTIHFLGFQQPAQNLALMAHADLFVLPSIYEPHGIVIPEAIAAGTPVLASNLCGAAPDLVKPGISGDLFISGNVADLQTKLEGLVADRAALLAMRASTHRQFEKWFAAHSPINVVEAAVKQMLQDRTSRTAAGGTNKKRIVLLLKLVILVGILAFVGRFIFKAWRDIHDQASKANMTLTWSSVDWRFGILAVFAFAGVMLTSAFTWRWLAGKMEDRTPALPAIGAYTFSQLGKYIPGKIALLLMRMERSARFGMTTAVCTLSTLLENALYMISGGLVGMVAIAHIAANLPPERHTIRAAIWPVTILAVIVLASACHPKVFYGLVNTLLQRMKKPVVPAAQQLRMPTLLLAVLAFVPCWLFGGFALWASASCIYPLPIGDCVWFIGAFSLSVIIGMISLLPGGAGIREVVLGTAVALQFRAAGMDHDHAVLLGTLVAVLQRVFQLVAEIILGIFGSLLTRKSLAARSSAAPSPGALPQ